MAKEIKPMIKLAIIRKQKKMTQEMLAERLGLSSTTVSQYERGVRNPNITTLAKIAKVLECTFNDLV